MKLVFCLGNIGAKYANTRHNVGFMVADALANEIGCNFTLENKFKAEIAKGTYKNEAIWIVKPQTYMNLSGEALNALKCFYKLNLNDLFLIYDDLSLDIGKIRFRAKGSDGGHNGIKSIIKYAGTQEFGRMKVGIGPQPPYMKSEDFVLQNFNKEEVETLKTTIPKCVEAFLYYCDTNKDIQKVQNKYN